MKLFDCRRVTRSAFVTERGFQPKHSLFYMLDGEFSYVSGDESVLARAGDILLFPDTVYFERRVLSPITFFYARFEPSEEEPPYTEVLRIAGRERLYEDFERMAELSRTPGSRTAEHYLADVLLAFEPERTGLSEASDPVVLAAVAYFRAHLGGTVTLSEVAHAAGVSQSLLSMRFRALLGCPPIAYLNFLRIERARELFSEGGRSVAEVGALCGFEDPYYFSNAFLKATGMRPKEYARQYRL